jgi:hypothetical protein
MTTITKDVEVAKFITTETLRALVNQFGIHPSKASKMVRDNHVFVTLLNGQDYSLKPEDIARSLLENSLN